MLPNEDEWRTLSLMHLDMDIPRKSEKDVHHLMILNQQQQKLLQDELSQLLKPWPPLERMP